MEKLDQNQHYKKCCRILYPAGFPSLPAMMKILSNPKIRDFALFAQVHSPHSRMFYRNNQASSFIVLQFLGLGLADGIMASLNLHNI